MLLTNKLKNMDARKISCDCIIVGAGSAGIEAYKTAKQNGAQCILVESGPLGTTAHRTGDIPSCLLFAAGKAAHTNADAEKFGLKFKNKASFDKSNVLNSLRASRAQSTTEVLSFLYKIPDDERIIGKAGFIDAHHVHVGENLIIEFKTAVIATGSTPVIPYELGKLGGILTTDDFFETDRIKNSVAVFGSGLVGLRLGQALSYLGVDVTVFCDENLWLLTDETVIAKTRELLRKSMKLSVNSNITSIEKLGDLYGIYYLDENNFENFITVEQIISAGSRYPKIDGMKLRDIGIKLSPFGFIDVDEKTLQTSIPHIFAAGDVIGHKMSTNLAKETGRVAGFNAANLPHKLEMNSSVAVHVLPTEPAAAIVGLSFNEVKERAKLGFHFVIGESHADKGIYRCEHTAQGLIRLYCDLQNHCILGAEMCAPQCDHLAHFLALAIQKKMTADELSAFSFFHLTYEEALNDAAKAAVKAINQRKGTNYYARS